MRWENINKFEPLFKSKGKRYVVAWGGRGSGKSWSVASYLILKALEEKCIILCTREHQISVKDSVHHLLEETISRLELSDYFVILDREIRCKNGSKFIFSGLQNIKNIKSKEAIKYVWIEEADNLNKVTFEIVDPTIRVDDSQIIMVFNLQFLDDYPYTNFVLKERDDTLVINANYYDNPFLSKALIMQKDYAKANDIELYNHVWGGQARQVSDALVFKNKYVSEYFEVPEDVIFYFGSDFGYSKDPATLIKSFIVGNELFICDECYEVGVEIDDLSAFYDRIYDRNVGWMIIADSQRPDTISHIRNKGFNIKGAKKGAGSVEDGVKHLKSFKRIVIHPRCKNTMDEFNRYSFKVDPRTGNILPILVDKFNHIIDALRYSLEDIRRGQGEFTPVFASDSNSWDEKFFNKSV